MSRLGGRPRRRDNRGAGVSPITGAGRRSVLLPACAALAVAACGPPQARAAARAVAGGDVERGRVTIEAYGCGSCHMIPGAEAQGMVGPPLVHFASRVYIAGVMPNTPERLITWLTVPQAVKPGNAMPDLGLTDGEARDVAAYLYSLR